MVLWAAITCRGISCSFSSESKDDFFTVSVQDIDLLVAIVGIQSFLRMEIILIGGNIRGVQGSAEKSHLAD
jgi:hypothetical protein